MRRRLLAGCSVCAMLLLVGAGIAKIASPTSPELDAATGSRISIAIGRAMPVVGGLEILIGVLCVVPLTRRVAARIATAFFVLVGAYLVWLRMHGVNVHRCGCFGTSISVGLAWHTLIVGIGLLASMAVLMFGAGTER